MNHFYLSIKGYHCMSGVSHDENLVVPMVWVAFDWDQRGRLGWKVVFDQSPPIKWKDDAKSVTERQPFFFSRCIALMLLQPSCFNVSFYFLWMSWLENQRCSDRHQTRVTVKATERVQFWHENVPLLANHSSALLSRRAVIGWEVYIFMLNLDFDGTLNALLLVKKVRVHFSTFTKSVISPDTVISHYKITLK